MSGKLHKIAGELGVVAQNLDGRFIMMDVRSLDDRPPQDQLWVVVDFDTPEREQAIEKAKQIGDQFDVPIRTSLYDDMDQDFMETMSVSAAVYQIGERWQFAKLIRKHPRLSRPKLHGWEIDVGWVDIVDRFFDVVDCVVPESVGFDVIQIKEKFGGLRLYCRPVRPQHKTEQIDDDVVVNLRPRKLEAWEKEFQLAKVLAEQRSYFVCERCGQPGRLRVRGGYYFTACDEHATKDGHIAEIVVSQSVIPIDGRRLKYDHNQDQMVEIEPIFEDVDGLTDMEVRAIHRNLREQHELDDFTVLYAVKRLDWGNTGAGYFAIIRLNETKEIRLIETETWGQLSLPAEDVMSDIVKEYRDLADKTEAMLERYRELKSFK
ncbi:hypothetical protein F9K94_21290 [Brucella tritici]|uniref:Uncharacterized protein n=1 Tax=Brucella tritici TaxID=94626 RepID=A0A7V7VR52_9HYPH|nr:hypothetical protein [Brucella tritici]KAB2655094.1 hypothetical protein F9K94_21290 [Brucella tritici]